MHEGTPGLRLKLTATGYIRKNRGRNHIDGHYPINTQDCAPRTAINMSSLLLWDCSINCGMRFVAANVKLACADHCTYQQRINNKHHPYILYSNEQQSEAKASQQRITQQQVQTRQIQYSTQRHKAASRQTDGQTQTETNELK